jgi:hypothetical protein
MVMEMGQNIDTNHESPICLAVNTSVPITTPLSQAHNVVLQRVATVQTEKVQ